MTTKIGTETPVTIHPFEKAGLGLAPFRFTGLSENVINHGDHVQAGGCCDYCYTGIRYECHIQSSDGKRFKVGTDCVLKLDRADNRLISDVKRAKANHDRKVKAEKREAARVVEWERTRPEREARQAEWARIEAERVAKEVTLALENAWLLDVLRSTPAGSGGFVDSMIESLGRSKLADLSPRCIEILGQIYAKAKGGRVGSKAYRAALDEFESRI